MPPHSHEGPRTLRILLVEDSSDDAELIGFALRNAPFAFAMERVETAPQLRAAIDAAAPDVVLCDYHLPQFSMAEALQIVRAERALEVPFIVVSRLIGEDAAVEAMRNGVDDYLLKGRLGRLHGAISAALERREARRGRALAEAALRRMDVLNRSVLASLATRVAVVGGDGVILAVNGAWERARQHGALGPDAPVVGGNYLEFLRDAGAAAGPAQAVLDGIEAVIARREPAFYLEYQLPGRTGSRWESVRAVPLQDSEHGAVVTIEDITARMLSQLALHDSHEQLQRLSRRVLVVQEEERRAMALELHDDLGQTLAALKIALHGLTGRLAGGEAAVAAQCLAITDEVLEKLRHISHSLRPAQLDQFGLGPALRELAGQYGASGIKVECRLAGLDRRPPAEVEAACFRIAQEALNNATRHGKAQLVVVQAEVQDRLLELVVRDDGAGFDEAEARARAGRSGSLGLLGMAERAQLAGGRFRVRSTPGAGTRVSATFPMDGAGGSPREGGA